MPPIFEKNKLSFISNIVISKALVYTDNVEISSSRTNTFAYFAQSSYSSLSIRYPNIDKSNHNHVCTKMERSYVLFIKSTR